MKQAIKLTLLMALIMPHQYALKAQVLSPNAVSQNTNDSIFQKEGGTLGEVVVKGRSYIRKSDRVIIVPNKLDTKHSYTGYDLLYNLMIPGMDVDRNSGTVNAMGGIATLYINGVKADYRDIQNLKPKEVVKIEYLESPSGKYSGDIASINFIVKTYQYGGYVALDGTQTIGYLKGDYNVASKLSHGTTSYTLFAGHTMQEYDNKKNHETEDFLFSNYSLTRNNNIANEHIEKNQQYAQFNVLNQDNKRTLQAKFSFVRSASPKNSLQSLLTYSSFYDNSSSMSASNDQSITPSIELYGGFNPKKNHWMEFRIGGSYSNNRYNREYTAGDYRSLSNVREDMLSVPVMIKYTMPLKNGSSLSASLMNLYNSSNSDYYGTNASWQHLWTNETLFFLYYNWQINKKVSLNNRAGFSYEVYRLHGNDKVSHFSPRLNTMLSYNISQIQQLYASLAIGNSYPVISMLNSAEQSVDILHLKRGNPLLDNAFLYSYSVMYNLQMGRFRFLGKAGAEHSINMSMPTYNAENDKIVETYYSEDNYSHYEISVDLSYRPIDALNLRIKGNYDAYQITGMHELKRDQFSMECYVNYYWKDFSFNVSGKTKQKKMVEKCLVEVIDPTYNVSIGWHHGNWYTEIGANNFFTRNHEYRTEIISDSYHKTSYQYNRTDQQSAYVKLAYSFDFGKKTNRDYKNVNTEINSAILRAK